MSDHAGGGRRRRRRATTPGAPPGQLVADPEALPPVMHVIAYGPDGLEEHPLASADDLVPLLARWPVTWVNVDGLADAALLARFGDLLHLHRLALEDVLHVHQRPKLDRYDGHDFVIAAMTNRQPDATLGTEQLGLFFGKNFVLGFQEQPGDCFDGVRRRLREGSGRIRQSGPDYLVYALLDSIVDSYYPVLESVSDRLEALESDVLTGSAPRTIGDIHCVRRDLLVARRVMWPTRELVASLSREEGVVTAETRLYLRDLYDHTIELIDMLENLRDIGAGLMEVHLTVASHRMNQVMTVLTVIATIFMPLTFISGVYGMNFDTHASPFNMPELHWRYGYPMALGFMAVTALAMLYFFKRRGWIGRSSVTFAIDPARRAAQLQPVQAPLEPARPPVALPAVAPPAVAAPPRREGGGGGA